VWATPADVGVTFVSDEFSEPGFLGLVAGITDGEDDFAHFGFGLLGGGGMHSASREGNWFFPDDPLRVDFAGLDIERIGLTIDELVFSHTSVGNTAWSYRVTYTANPAAVPEPHALLFLGSGLAFLRRR